jgi:hypothetical protein
MKTNAEQMRVLLKAELQRVTDPGRRQHLQSFLTEPSLRSFAWDYGPDGQRFEVWVVGLKPGGEVALAYAEEGFGPAFPWGFLDLAVDSLGMDSQWHSGLEDAAIGAGLVDPPPGYTVPGPR